MCGACEGVCVGHVRGYVWVCEGVCVGHVRGYVWGM